MAHERNSRRLEQIAHYIIARTPADMLGATKLNKVLWFVDCHSFRQHGVSMTGLTHYIRLENGPVPEGLSSALSELKLGGKISEDSRTTPAGVRREFHSLEDPDLDGMSASEIDLIHQVIEAIRPLSARQVSDLTHDALWREVANGASMPVSAGSLLPEPLSDDAYRWAMAEASRLAPNH